MLTFLCDGGDTFRQAILYITRFFINVQGQYPHQWAAFQVAGALVKLWPCSSSLGLEAHSGPNLLNLKQDSIAHSLSLSSAHHPDMTEILLKGHKIYSHPSNQVAGLVDENKLNQIPLN